MTLIRPPTARFVSPWLRDPSISPPLPHGDTGQRCVSFYAICSKVSDHGRSCPRESAPRRCVRRGDREASWRHVFQLRPITHSRRQIRIPACTRYCDQRNAVRVPPGPISPTLRRPLALASTSTALNRNPSDAVNDTRARSRSAFERGLPSRSRSRVCILSTKMLVELPEGKSESELAWRGPLRRVEANRPAAPTAPDAAMLFLCGCPISHLDRLAGSPYLCPKARPATTRNDSHVPRTEHLYPSAFH